MSRHAQRAQQSRATTNVSCNNCGKVIATVRTKKLKDRASEARIVAHWKAHQAKTGCAVVVPARSIASAIPEHLGTTMVEMLCAGCGLILLTKPATIVKTDLEGTQKQVDGLLAEHVSATGCAGVYDPAQPKPARRDGRCKDGEHVDGCRCDREGTGQVFAMLPQALPPDPILPAKAQSMLDELAEMTSDQIRASLDRTEAAGEGPLYPEEG
jgi:ribosomal protein S27E